MLKHILNGIFSTEYYIDLIKIKMAEYIMDRNTLGTQNKIKIDLTRLFHDEKIYKFKIDFKPTLNDDPNKIVLDFCLKPTILSCYSKYRLEMTMKAWNKNLISVFTEDQLVELHTHTDFHLTFLSS